jgi:hypothetical protein
MAADIIVRQGETAFLEATITQPDGSAFTVTAVPVQIVAQDDGTTTTASGTVDEAAAPSDSDTSHVIAYRWTTSGATSAEDYSVFLGFTVSGVTKYERFPVTVIPLYSKFDRWVDAVRSLVQENDAGEAAAGLSFRDYMEAVSEAVEDYSRDKPRKVTATETLSAGDWEYTLPAAAASPITAGWINGFSRFTEFEYEVDDTLRTRPLYPDDGSAYEVHEGLGVYRFLLATPAAGETARLRYTTYHSLTHTADTLPADDFRAVARYAAGCALLRYAGLASHTDGPALMADTVGFSDRSSRYTGLAATLKKEGQRLWKRGRIYM